jgi:hypothetical protein
MTVALQHSGCVRIQGGSKGKRPTHRVSRSPESLTCKRILVRQYDNDHQRANSDSQTWCAILLFDFRLQSAAFIRVLL